MIEFLSNGEIYCKVCSGIFPSKTVMVAHRAVIQTLSRNGIYVVEDGDIAVTDSALQQKKPFRKVSIRASFFSTAYNTVHSVKPQCNMTEHLTENHSTLSNLKMMCI